MLIVPITTPLMIMINNMVQEWQQGKLALDELIFGSGIIMFFVLFTLLPLFILKIWRINKQEEVAREIAKELYERDRELADDNEIKAMRKERHSLEMKRRRTDINVAEVKNATELQMHKMVTEKRLDLLTSASKELDARTTLKTAIAFTIFNKQSKDALAAITELETSEAVQDKIQTLEDQMESLAIQSLEQAEKATKNYQEALAGGLPIEVDYKSKSIECPTPPGAEVTLEDAPVFEAKEKELEEEQLVEILESLAKLPEEEEPKKEEARPLD